MLGIAEELRLARWNVVEDIKSIHLRRKQFSGQAGSAPGWVSTIDDNDVSNAKLLFFLSSTFLPLIEYISAVIALIVNS